MNRSLVLALPYIAAGIALSSLPTQSAWAQASASDPTGTVSSDDSSPSATPAAPKRLSLIGISNTMSGLQSTSDPNYTAETDFNLIAAYKISNEYFLTSNFGFRKEFNNQDRILGQDGLVGVAHTGIQLNPYIKITPSSAIRIPISEQSSDYDSMYGGVQAAVKFDFDGAGIGVKRLSLTYIATVGQNFYQYDQALSGGIISAPNATQSLPAAISGGGAPAPAGGASPDLINIEYDLKNVALVNYQLSSKFSLLGTGIYVMGYDYYGNTRGNFELSEELDYQVAKQINVGLGFSNGGDVLRPDGQSSNVELYNANSANVYASIILTY